MIQPTMIRPPWLGNFCTTRTCEAFVGWCSPSLFRPKLPARHQPDTGRTSMTVLSECHRGNLVALILVYLPLIYLGGQHPSTGVGSSLQIAALLTPASMTEDGDLEYFTWRMSTFVLWYVLLSPPSDHLDFPSSKYAQLLGEALGESDRACAHLPRGMDRIRSGATFETGGA